MYTYGGAEASFHHEGERVMKWLFFWVARWQGEVWSIWNRYELCAPERTEDTIARARCKNNRPVVPSSFERLPVLVDYCSSINDQSL